MTHQQTKVRTLRGPRIIKTARGIISCAAIVGAGVLIAPGSASAQTMPLDCLPESIGPTAGEPTPYGGGMCDLGVTGDGTRSVALGISGNGQVVVGYLDTASDDPRGDISAFTWTEQNGMIELEPLSATSRTVLWRARAVNDDGSIVVGNARNYVNTPRPVRWVNGNIEELGTLYGVTTNTNSRADSFSGNAFGVNADGNVVVGWTYDGNILQRAFRWVEGSSSGVAANPQMQDLGTLKSNQLGTSFALGTDSSGAIVVGYAEDDNGDNRAFRWVENRTDGRGAISNPEMQDLGTFTSTLAGESYAWNVNSNGAVVVGYAEDDNGDNRAFRWVENRTDGRGATNNPEMQNLGTLKSDQTGNSFAYGVSADGFFVVGQAENDDGEFRAFRWVAGSSDGVASNLEMQDLGTLRSDQTGNSVANGVSADGSVVVGASDADGGLTRAFIWRTQIQDFTNLMLSFPILANDTEIAVVQQQAVVGRLMDQTCLAEAGQSCMNVGGWLANTGSTAAQDIGSRTSGVATLSYGRGLDGQTTLGGTLSLSNTNLSSNGFDMGNAAGISLWAEYSQGGLSRTGLQAGAAIGYGRESGDITRGRGLDNVMLATGEADLTTTAARATLGYGFAQQDWLITPSLTLAHYSTKRSAYAETGADFNASYDELSMERTTATLAVAGEYKVSEQGTLSLGAGVEHDLNADRVTLTGASTVPGMAAFAVNSTLDRRDTRGFFDIGYTHDLGNNRTLSSSARVGQAAFGSKPQVGLGITYAMRF